MSRPDEGLIHTWLDGECTPDEAARIERLVATDPEWAAAVAEARGLVAASARIVQALDAVPKAMPAGSRAAPAARRPSGFRVRSWMQVAAGLVLVAGTAYVLREEPRTFEAPTGQVDLATPPPATPASGAAEAAASAVVATSQGVGAPARADSVRVATSSVATIQPPTDLPLGEVRSLERVVPAPTAGASVPFSVAPPSAVAPAPPPPTRAALARGSEETALTAGQEKERREAIRSRMTIEPSRAAAAAAPMADALMGRVAEKALPTLAGCWRVSAPPELVGVLREPMIVRQSGDTLVLRTARGDLTVTRTSDRLRGGLEATLETCPTGQ